MIAAATSEAPWYTSSIAAIPDLVAKTTLEVVSITTLFPTIIVKLHIREPSALVD